MAMGSAPWRPRAALKSSSGGGGASGPLSPYVQRLVRTMGTAPPPPAVPAEEAPLRPWPPGADPLRAVPDWVRDMPDNPLAHPDMRLPPCASRDDALRHLDTLLTAWLPRTVAGARFVSAQQPNYRSWTQGGYHTVLLLDVMRHLTPTLFPPEEDGPSDSVPSCATLCRWLLAHPVLTPTAMCDVVVYPRLIAAALWAMATHRAADDPVLPGGRRYNTSAVAQCLVWALNVRAPVDGRVCVNARAVARAFNRPGLHARFVHESTAVVIHTRSVKHHLLLREDEYLRCRDVVADMLRALTVPICHVVVAGTPPSTRHALVWPDFTHTYPVPLPGGALGPPPDRLADVAPTRVPVIAEAGEDETWDVDEPYACALAAVAEEAAATHTEARGLQWADSVLY